MSEIILAPKVGLESVIESKFEDHKKQAEQWLDKAKTLRVTDAGQTELMKQCREARLALRAIRVNIEKLHKSEKEEYLQGGRIIDKLRNKYVALIEPIEEVLMESENFVEIQEAGRKVDLRNARLKELTPLIGNEASTLALGEMSEGVYQDMVAGIKVRIQAQAEQLEEDARKRREQEEENKRTQKMHARADKLRLLGFVFHEQSTSYNNSELGIGMAKNEIIKMSDEHFDHEVKRLTSKYTDFKEREKKKKEVLEQKLMKERADRKRLEDAEKDRLEKIETEKKEKVAAERKLNRAPDKEKVLTLSNRLKALSESPADAVFTISIPKVKDEQSEAMLRGVRELLLKTATYIEKNAKDL